MAAYNYMHEEFFDSQLGVISPGAYDDPLLDSMFDMSPIATQACHFDSATAAHMAQMGMMTPGAFEQGIAGLDSHMHGFGQEPWSSADGMNYNNMMHMNLHSPPSAGHYTHSHRPSLSSRSNSIALSQGSSFATSAGFTSPSTPMSRGSSMAPSMNNYECKMAPANEGWEPEDVHVMGYRDENAEWRCKHEGCTSKKTFTRACDLRKHFRLHEKSFFCSKPDCPWSRIGFSLRKDCKRHEASHKPEIECPSEGCDRTFSRSDNMKEHYKKIHQRAQNNALPKPSRKRATGRN